MAKKSKELLLAEIAYADGRASMFENDDEGTVFLGPELALAKWKEQTGGKKPQPTEIERARKKWTEEGCPTQGTLFGASSGGFGGNWFVFAPDGSYLLKESFEKNFDVKRAGG
jgi:hypothetical protein